MLGQLVLMESERLVPKSMCEGYRKPTTAVLPVKAPATRSAAAR
jgi:hypothetical protein